jgi:hypothetical protein
MIFSRKAEVSQQMQVVGAVGSSGRSGEVGVVDASDVGAPSHAQYISANK